MQHGVALVDLLAGAKTAASAAVFVSVCWTVLERSVRGAVALPQRGHDQQQGGDGHQAA